MKKQSRIISLLMALIMMISILPVGSAEEVIPAEVEQAAVTEAPTATQPTPGRAPTAAS